MRDKINTALRDPIPLISEELSQFDTTNLTHHQYALLVNILDKCSGATKAEVQTLLIEENIPFDLRNKNISVLLDDYCEAWYSRYNYYIASMQIDAENPICPRCGEEGIVATHAAFKPEQPITEHGLQMTDGDIHPCRTYCKACNSSVYWKAINNIPPKKNVPLNFSTQAFAMGVREP
jgi:hypothetical protein